MSSKPIWQIGNPLCWVGNFIIGSGNIGKVVAGDSRLMIAGGADQAYFLASGVDSRIMLVGGSDQDYHKATAGDAGIGSVSAGDGTYG